MSAAFEVESTLTDRYQTTVPETVRRALKLNKRDRIHYTIQNNGEVILTRAGENNTEDPVIQSFLGFLAADMTAHPDQLRAIDTDLLNRITSLTEGMQVNLNERLPDGDE
ncbi:MAG: type II toxin-antitoxin system PrlF family antitoxin [Pseudohongiella sp.]|nr:type II toxin-antitoxin system PrlF family antitoxin [Pseudohongiella sp.]